MKFLDDVLPQGGFRCLSLEASINISHEDNVTLESHGLSRTGNNVYFAAASFKSPPTGDGATGSGARADVFVAHRRAFILDIDARPDNPACYATVEEMTAELVRAIKSSDLHTPSYVVHTGRGLHVYWLGEDYDLNRFSHINEAFCGKLVSCLDPRMVQDLGTTKRASGVYRLPGSLNHRSSPPSECRILFGDGARCTEWLEALPLVPYMPQVFFASAYPRPAWLTGTPVKGLGDFPDMRDYSFDDLHGNCAQFRYAYDNAGSSSYDGWMQTGKLISRMPDAQARWADLCGRWPDEHEYDPEEKLNDASKMADGMFCKTYAEANNDPERKRCLSCRFFKDNAGSPLQAAERRPEVAAQDVEQPPINFVRAAHTTDEYFITDENRPEDIPVFLKLDADGSPITNFFMAEDGSLRSIITKKDDDGKYIKIQVKLADRPFWMVSRYNNEQDDRDRSEGEQQLQFEHWASARYNPTTGVTGFRKHKMDFEDTKTASSIRAIAYQSLFVLAEPQKIVDAELIKYVHACRTHASSLNGDGADAYSHVGWTENKKDFVLGDYLYSGNGQRKRISHTTKSLAKRKLGVSGNPEKMLQALRVYEQPGVCDEARTLLLASIASPLLGITKSKSFVVLATGKSGSGKSAMQGVALSVWGAPIIVATASHDTENFRRMLTSSYRNLPVPYDEVVGADPAETLNYLLTISQNRGKGRAAMQNGRAVMADDDEQWETVILASTNKTLNDLIGGAITDQSDAARYRVLEMEYPAQATPRDGVWPELLASVNNTLEENYGWLGAMFLDYVQTNRTEIDTRFKAHKKALTAICVDAVSYRMMIDGVACMQVAADILTEQGWLMCSMWTSKAVEELKGGAALRQAKRDREKLDADRRAQRIADEERAVAERNAPVAGGSLAVAAVTPVFVVPTGTPPVVPASTLPSHIPSAASFFAGIMTQNAGKFASLRRGQDTSMFGAGRFAVSGVTDEYDFDGTSVGYRDIFVTAVAFTEYCRTLSRGAGQIDPSSLLSAWAAHDPCFTRDILLTWPDAPSLSYLPPTTYHKVRIYK